MSQHFQHDVLVIGSGGAGLSLALNLPANLRVAVLSKGELAGGSTYWAQGGVAGVLDDSDNVESHIQDTLTAGAGLCREDAVRFTVEHSREAIGRKSRHTALSPSAPEAKKENSSSSRDA